MSPSSILVFIILHALSFSVGKSLSLRDLKCNSFLPFFVCVCVERKIEYMKRLQLLVLTSFAELKDHVRTFLHEYIYAFLYLL